MLTKIFAFIFSGSLAYIILALVSTEFGDSNTILLALVVAAVAAVAAVLSKKKPRRKSSQARAVEDIAGETKDKGSGVCSE